MRYVFSLLSMVCLFTFSGMAQQRVALHHNGNTTIFSGSTPFIDAYNEAVSGDTIYLPGITLATPPTFNKKLVIIGTGHTPDSTLATGITGLGTINLQQEAAGAVFEGIKINGHVDFAANIRIDSVIFLRNYISGSISITGTGNPSRGIVIRENIIGANINAQHTSGIKIFNNIVMGITNIASNGWIANNIVGRTFSGIFPFNNVHQSLIENNIFGWSSGLNNVSNNHFVKNITNGDPSSITNNSWEGNWIGQDFSNVFVNYEFPFSYSADYHLKNPAGFTGTSANQVGLYGGLYPAKEGGVPSNPHISSKVIGTTVDQQGKLEVQIKAIAQ